MTDNSFWHIAALDAAEVERIKALEAENKALRGAMQAQDDRERQAGEKCGVLYEEWGCDWPYAVAEQFLWLQEERDALRRKLDEHERMAWNDEG